MVSLVTVVDSLSPFSGLKVCMGKVCSKGGLAQQTLEFARALAGERFKEIEETDCKGRCGAGRVSVVGPSSERVYDVRGASPATVAALLEIEAGIAVADEAVDACSRLQEIDAIRHRGDRRGARDALREDMNMFLAFPLLRAAALVRHYDLCDDETRDALEEDLIASIQDAPQAHAVSWRLAALYEKRGECAKAAEVLNALLARDSSPATAANVAESLESCPI